MRAVLLAMLIPVAVHAQGVDRRFAEPPTDGVALPTVPLAGEHDATAVTLNPGGLALLRGPEIALAIDSEDSAVATSSGPGVGAYFASTVGGGIFPRVGLGFGFEWLRPPREDLAPDPGTPLRYTLGYAVSLGTSAGFGASWHHYFGEGALSGKNAFDLGLSVRWTSYLALGAVLRDLATADIAGTPVQRRYELEAVVRPFQTDRLELAVGGQLGETRLDLDGWGRIVGRVARGVYVTAGVESRALHTLEDSPSGISNDLGGRDYRATVGVTVSLGRMGVSALGTGVRGPAGDNHPLGGTLIARASVVGLPSVLGAPDHIERIDLQGTISQRELTAHVLRLRAIAHDASVKALVVMLDGAAGGWAGLEELRDEILAIRHAGKTVFAIMVSGTGRDYFVASAANRIYLDPAGELRLIGMSGTTLYFRGLLDQLGVLPQFEKVAEFKSAPEELTETKATPIAAQMRAELFDSLWERWVAAVADGRHLTPERVRALVDGGPYTAGDLVKDHELIDAVASPDKLSTLIARELGGVYPVSASEPERPESWQRPGVAIIYIDGDITDSASHSLPLIGQELAGGATLIAAIDAARDDPRVGAIVLRIDSPGGSSLASELISREVFQTRGVKPIVCSMSNVAASGGYFAAAGCDTIYAEPMTITGSIGIFSGKVDVSGLLAKLGITTESYTHGAHGDLDSHYRAWSDDERARLLDNLRYMYGRFVGAVAEGRKLTKDQVDAVGRGHVFSGEQAMHVKLIDKFGGLADALDDAKRRMGLAAGAKVELYELPRLSSSVLGQIGHLLSATPAPSLLDVPAVRELLRSVPASLLDAPDSPQARLPFDITWQ